MKKGTGRIIFFSAIGLLFFLICGIVFRKAKADEAASKIRKFPDLILTDSEGKLFRTDQIKSGPLLLIFFHPECEHCLYAISSLLACDIPDKQALLLVTCADRPEVRAFMQQLNIIDKPNLHVLVDTELEMIDFFRADIVPSTFIYTKDLQLVKVFKGEIKTETIMKYVNSND